MTSPATLLTVAEVAAELRVDPATVRLWARQGKIPVVKLPGGRLKRFRREDVDAILASNASAS